jgi:uncharacterized protein
LPILEKLADSTHARHWTDSIPLEYQYTAGVAGEDFRRELRESGRFLASKCVKCNTKYVPARMFCPSCFVEMKEHFTIDEPGTVYSFTTIPRDRQGRRMSTPAVLALVKFQGVTGGIVHRLDAEDPETVVIGLKVQPVFKDPSERTGALTDILAFVPVGTIPSKSLREPAKTPRDQEGRERARALLEMIDESGYPIGDEESVVSTVRTKLGRGEGLSQKEDEILHRLADKAREWHRAEKTSSETEREDTMSG